MKTIKDEILEFFSSKLNRDEKARKYEKEIARFAYSHSSEEGIQAFTELMGEGQEYAYEAFFSLATIHRHDRDFTKLWNLISEAEKRRCDGGAAGQEWQNKFLCVQRALVILWMAAVQDISNHTNQRGNVAADRSENRSGVTTVQISQESQTGSAGNMICCLNQWQRLLSSIRSRLTQQAVHSKLFL